MLARKSVLSLVSAVGTALSVLVGVALGFAGVALALSFNLWAFLPVATLVIALLFLAQVKRKNPKAALTLVDYVMVGIGFVGSLGFLVVYYFIQSTV